MAVFIYSAEAVSKVPAQRLFKAMTVHRSEVMQKLKPDFIKSHEIIEGDGGAGTITKVHFVEGHPFEPLVIRIDELDLEKLHCKYTMIEGGKLRDNLEKIEHVADFEAVGTESKAKVTVYYHPKPGCSVDEEAAKMSEEKKKEILPLLEEYLTAKPDLYA